MQIQLLRIKKGTRLVSRFSSLTPTPAADKRAAFDCPGSAAGAAVLRVIVRALSLHHFAPVFLAHRFLGALVRKRTYQSPMVFHQHSQLAATSRLSLPPSG